MLNKETSSLTVGDIVRALEGQLAPVECVNDDQQGACRRVEFCVTKMVWEDLKNAIDRVLDSYTLEDLVLETKKKQENAYSNYCI